MRRTDEISSAPLGHAECRQMELRGVRVHNLKNLDLDIPLNRLVVLSGVSGSGKSSLAFETLFAEGQRRYIESFSVAARQHLERVERPNADRIAHVPVALAIRSDQSRRIRFDARSTVAIVAELLDGIRMLLARAGRIVCLDCGREVRSQSAADVVRAITALPAGTRCQLGFSVTGQSDAETGSAWLAKGFSRAVWDGVTHDLNMKPAWPDSDDVWIVVDRIVAGTTADARIMESAETALREGAGRCFLLIGAADSSDDETHVVDARTWRLLRFNRRLQCAVCGRQYLPVEPRLFSHLSSGACPICRGVGHVTNEGSVGTACAACHGTRFRDEALAVQIDDLSIAQLCARSAPEVAIFVRDLKEKLPADVQRQTDRVRDDIAQRLKVVCDLGLDYLTLDRSSESLSGGEIRRLMLAAAIGSRITGALVVVDEPGAGLAVSELPRVVAALRRLQSFRNSVIAVDHAPLIVSSADHVIELGPGAGPHGGNVVYQGAPVGGMWSGAGLREPPDSRIPANKRLEKGARKLCLNNVQHHNLDNLGFEFPLNRLCVVTGPSGSGKTSLVTQVLYPAVCRRLDIVCALPQHGRCDLSGGEGLVDVVLVDQSPLTRSSRSNPATWLEVFDEIRRTFAATLDAKQRGYTARHFSFNSLGGGRCRSCQGTGMLKHDMQFLPDVTLPCPECGGSRYGKEVLEVKYRGRSIADVLSMSVLEAASFFRSQPRIQNRFQIMKQFGLDYLVLGQPSETFSGGEAQRLKLAARIAAPTRGPCLILCDDPTNGLHSTDVGRLVTGFREMIANGHSLILADNSPDLLAAADDIIELRR